MTMITMKIIVFFSIYLYNVFLLKGYEGIAEFRFDKMRTILFFSIILSIGGIFCGGFEITLFKSYIILFLLYMIIFKIIFDETISTIYILVIHQIFLIAINLDIIIGLFALVNRKSIYEITQDYNLFVLIFSLNIVIMSIILNKQFYKEIFKKFLLYRKKLSGNIFILTSLVIILLILNYLDYNFNKESITVAIMIINRICIYFYFYFTVYMGISSIKWEEKELIYKTNLLNIEYNKNMSEKIDEYYNLLKMYNHDFKNILNNINDSIECGDVDKAKRIIFEFNEQIQIIIKDNKNFSNNKLINAIFNRLNEQCKVNNIYLEADCYIPNYFNISELELLKIFNNLSSNAYEACIRQNESEERRIIFKSYVKENYFIIYEKNSFNGEIKIRKNKLITTKKNKKHHGIGVESIKHIINSIDGLAITKVDKQKKEFKFLIKIPLNI